MFITQKELDLKIPASTAISLSNFFYVAQLEHIELYVVGGAVRNALLHQPPKDIDLCTSATPQEIIDIVARYNKFKEYEVIETGLKHGTVTIYNKCQKVSFEITTFRTDGVYTDHRRPDEVIFTKSLEEDLRRRDLTINSFAYNYLTHELIALDSDYLYDLEIGIIRTVGDPTARFKEDALRMLRVIRFAAQYGFSIDDETLQAITDLSPTLAYVSKERIRDELTKILISDHPEMLDFLYITGLDTYTLPFLLELLTTHQYNKYHYTDVLHHTYDVMRSVPKDPILRWAALFHDLGKPQVRTTDENGYDHFILHQEVSADRALSILQDLKFDNQSITSIYKLVKYHDAEVGDIKLSKFKMLIINVGEELFDKYLQLRVADTMAHRLYDGTQYNIKIVQSIAKARATYKKIVQQKCALTVKDLSVNGYDMMELGYKGQEIGAALNSCLEYVLEYPEKNVEEELIEWVSTNFKTTR